MATAKFEQIINVNEWIKANEKFFLPPVCNMMMHSAGQMKLFFVGGPNQRKDYHLEEGEEFFYMLRGDMCLKVVEEGVHRDVNIKQGEVFLLPANVFHSPQRDADTVGLVIERERLDQESDGLRYFVEKEDSPTLEPLFEQYFHCEDLGAQLKPIIMKYFASEQHKTGTPIHEELVKDPPVKAKAGRKLAEPFLLSDWLLRNFEKLENCGDGGARVPLFSDAGNDEQQFTVDVIGKGTTSGKVDSAQVWIWVLEQEGGSSAKIEVHKSSGDKQSYDMYKEDSLLIEKGHSFTMHQTTGTRSLLCYQQPRHRH